ncbi:hypothetical protein B0H14DRAFT_2619125 [Mycena olivaceomarginata]|nr:hypothetical protein B0H14DRAFT_2619125 [Mycena olivaceomarginata]
MSNSLILREMMSDIENRTHSILKFFQNHGVPGRKIDYLYVDETQDDLLIDTLLCYPMSLDSDFFLNPFRASDRKNNPEFNFHPAVPPRVFQLTVNYRSHAGIVNCARSAIEVITKLYRSEGPIELGAQQCILVRNDAARKKLQNLVGDIGLIMTLHESKGLEFNDAQWGVVLNVMDNGPPAPTLDNMRHASVCAEFKFLYVAITRARNNIWIADCSTKGEPMRQGPGAKLCIRHIYSPLFHIVGRRRSDESKEENYSTISGSLKQDYAIRVHICHIKPPLPRAYHLREEASEMPCNFRRQIVARKAAFWVWLPHSWTARKNDPGDAALVYFRRAGECFKSAEEVLFRAITAYTCARYFGRVAELYQHLGKFDEAVATVQTHSQDIDPDIAKRVIGVARFNKGRWK